MNRENLIISKVGTLVQDYVKLLKSVFKLKINYTGFEYFQIIDNSNVYQLILKCNEDITLIADIDTTISVNSWTVSYTTVSDNRLGNYLGSLVGYIIEEFGSSVHSVTFSMKQGIASEYNELSSLDNEVSIIWSLIRPSGFKSSSEELQVNKYHYQHLLEKESSNEPLLFGEAYYFALKYYNKGGDTFVECCEPKDFEWHKSMGMTYTKKSMLKNFKILDSKNEEYREFLKR